MINVKQLNEVEDNLNNLNNEIKHLNNEINTINTNVNNNNASFLALCNYIIKNELKVDNIKDFFFQIAEN